MAFVNFQKYKCSTTKIFELVHCIGSFVSVLEVNLKNGPDEGANR